MYKFILTLSFLFFVFFTHPNKAVAVTDKATCLLGECEFFIGLWYDKAQTICTESLFFEDVDQQPFYFIIKKSGKKCPVIY